MCFTKTCQKSSMILRMFALFALITLDSVCADANSTILSFQKVHLIDVNKFSSGLINYFYRGNTPKVNNTFAFDTLAQYMSIRANESGLPFPSSFYFIDLIVSGMNDEPDWNIENVYWNVSGYKYNFGYAFQWELTHYPASNYDPSDMSQSDINDMCTMPSNNQYRTLNESYLWSHDQIPMRIDLARNLLLTERFDGLPTILYVHCEGGCDRTGQFVAAYRLTYLMQNITNVYCLDCLECGRCPNSGNTIGIEWYCNCYSIKNNKQVGDCNKWNAYAHININDTDLVGVCKEPYAML
eukprot:271719_1